MNVDASFCEDLFRAGTRIVVRDEVGQVMLLAAVSHDHVGSLDLEEGLTMVDGMRLVVEMGLVSIILEIDSMRVFLLLQDVAMVDLSELGVLVSEFRREVSAHL
ncbi:MAG: reverse transcriptase-like protein [Sweet potato little leaf phytoplasma]|nr:reverse transcriptase-like protein [Sweet potato little leaf phytoplasma]